MLKINVTGIKDNLQHIAGNIIGLVILKPLSLRFSKEQRGQYWFSTAAANIAASEVVATEWLPYVMVYKTK